MKKIAAIILFFTALNSIFAASRSKWMEGNNYVIAYDGVQMRFSSWDRQAQVYWETGKIPAFQSGNAAPANDMSGAVNANRHYLEENKTVIRRQAAQIDSLKKQIDILDRELNALKMVSKTFIWSSKDGKSFAGTFIEYNLGAVKIRRLKDGGIYTITNDKLSEESIELAIGLDHIHSQR